MLKQQKKHFSQGEIFAKGGYVVLGSFSGRL